MPLWCLGLHAPRTPCEVSTPGPTGEAGLVKARQGDVTFGSPDIGCLPALEERAARYPHWALWILGLLPRLFRDLDQADEGAPTTTPGPTFGKWA